MGILPGSGPLGSGPTGPGSGFSVMPFRSSIISYDTHSVSFSKSTFYRLKRQLSYIIAAFLLLNFLVTVSKI